jgi:GNAT superfamily N-acetyltransferase
MGAVSDLVISFLIAGLGSLLTFLIGFTVRKVRDWRLRKKYPVAGRFVTEYEDQIAGGVAVRKAITTLKQRGREVGGITVDLNGGRAWKLKGTIEKGGFLHGVYGAEDPHDSGQGTFFLRIEGTDGDMKGLWAGYDSEISDISQGGYSFRRCPESKIQAAVDADAPSVCALLGDALGALYVDLESIRSIMAPDNEDATCLIAVDVTGQIVGALTAAIFDEESLGGALPLGQAENLQPLPALLYHEHFCMIRSVAVVPHCMGRGIGTELVSKALEWARGRSATAAISFGWKSSQGCHIDGVMKTAGFRGVSEVPNFWTEDSRSKKYSCPECGAICECAAVVFKRTIDARAATALSA